MAGLARRERLPDRSAFTHVFDRAHASRDRNFTVLARAGQTAHTRLGVVVSKRVARGAVARNRIKRLVRESFRHHKHLLDSLDVVVIAKGPACALDNKALLIVLKKHWSRLAKPPS